MECKIMVYALSTCGWCHRTLKWFEENKIACDTVYVDQLDGDELDEAKEIIKKYNPSYSFPTVVVDNGRAVIVGYKPEEFERELKK